MTHLAPSPVTVKACVAAVSAHFSIPEIDLLSSRRTRDLIRPRQIAMYLAKQHTTRSLPEIGRRMGGRDHTTVIHGIRVVQNLIEKGDKLAGDVSAISDLLQAVAAGQLIARAELPDPVAVALDVVQRPKRAEPSAAEIAAMSAYIVERAIRSGEIAVDGSEAGRPDPELLPVVEFIAPPVVDRTAQQERMRTAVSKLLVADTELRAVLYGRGEINARRTFEGALEALRSAFEEA
jgi:hypothetical protein